MPYDGRKVRGSEQVRAEVERDMFLQGRVPEPVLASATSIQWVHSSFKDSGEDWSRADFYDKTETKIHSAEVGGY